MKVPAKNFDLTSNPVACLAYKSRAVTARGKADSQTVQSGYAEDGTPDSTEEHYASSCPLCRSNDLWRSLEGSRDYGRPRYQSHSTFDPNEECCSSW